MMNIYGQMSSTMACPQLGRYLSLILQRIMAIISAYFAPFQPIPMVFKCMNYGLPACNYYSGVIIYIIIIIIPTIIRIIRIITILI